MKIAVATQGNGGLDDIVSPIFGRAYTFTIVEIEGNEIKQVSVNQNPAAMAVGGAGPQAAQILASLGVSAVIAGNFGPNASMALSALGIRMIPGLAGVKVRDAIKQFIEGKISEFAPPAQQPFYAPMYPVAPPAPMQPVASKDLEIQYLETQIKLLEEQLKLINERIKELKSKQEQ